MHTQTLVLSTALALSTGCVATAVAVHRLPAEWNPAAYLGIPPGHLPPPGECRIWFPGLPPGQQPPPGRCGKLEQDVPLGAWLLYRPPHAREHVHVSVYDAWSPGVVVELRIYEAETGKYVRHEKR